MTTAQQRQALGAYGEKIAARHLIDHGMRVLDRNWRCHRGEIDLVLRDGDDLVICEVKARSGVGFGQPLTAVDPTKLARLRDLALLWAEQHGLTMVPIRIDLVGVLVSRGRAAEIEHAVGVC